jgi:hypothetical protein
MAKMMMTENQQALTAVIAGGIIGYFLFRKKPVNASGDITLRFNQPFIAQYKVSDIQGNIVYGPLLDAGEVTLPVDEYNINMNLYQGPGG